MTLTSKEGTVLKAGNPKEEVGLVEVKFVKNKVYEGQWFGPDYEEQVTKVKPYWARIFKAGGAVEIIHDPREDEADAGDGGPAALLGIQKFNVKEAAEEITTIDDARFLALCEELELAHPAHEGGRQGVLKAIAARAQELEEAAGEGEGEGEDEKGD